QKLHDDKGYDFPFCRQVCTVRHIKHRIARRGVDSSSHLGAVDKIYKGYFIWYNRKKRERMARMQLKIHMVTIEDLMPQDHFLRKLEKALDLSFVYEETQHLYNQKYGRPPIDPVILVKYLLVGFLYGIPSERQIEKRIETDIALRWYLVMDLLDRVPDHGPN